MQCIDVYECTRGLDRVASQRSRSLAVCGPRGAAGEPGSFDAVGGPRPLID